MKVAYIRVSTVDQNEGRQLKAMEHLGIEKTFIEKASAKNTERPVLKEMIEFTREGDTIYIESFSRLARSTMDLLQLVQHFNDKNVHLVSLKESLDTSTATGRLILTVISGIAQFERENLLERQREGIALAKAKGKYKGRKSIQRPGNWEEVYLQWKQRNLKGYEAMQLLGLNRTTFYKMVKEYEGEV